MKKNIKTILITNDDGFNAAGLKVLKEIAKLFTYDVYVIAPKFNQSAKSRSITLNHEINFEKKSDYEWIVDGTPTDCVIFAINYLMKEIFANKIFVNQILKSRIISYEIKNISNEKSSPTGRAK